jgi:SH3-like domain-containing protein
LAGTRTRGFGAWAAAWACRAAIAAIALSQAAPAAERGPITNLPLPRYVSLKAAEGNARRGPSLSHRIDWVFTRRDMPLQITGEYGHWRQVRDNEGAGGWMHYSLLSGVRTVLVTGDEAVLRMKPDPGAPIVAQAEPGVVARLDECARDWCRISASGRRGWTPRAALWGAEEAAPAN